MCDFQDTLKACHSCYEAKTRLRDSIHSESSWRSNVIITTFSAAERNPGRTRLSKDDCAEYYKRYEHDELPVKDAKQNTTENKTNKASMTNSHLEKLEKKIYKSISQGSQTSDSTVSSLESNIKLLKTTIKDIFDKFYTNVQDFKLYKQRFDDILAKNRAESIVDMQDFIKDMIGHMSMDSNLSHESRNWTEIPNTEVDANVPSEMSKKEIRKLLESFHSIVEAYKNENYLTDSISDDKPPKFDNCGNKGGIMNIYLLGDMPCRQSNICNRQLLSKISMEDQCHKHEHRVASAENFKKNSAKKQELYKYVKRQQETLNVADIEIPVKVSLAKKDLYLNEDFAQEKDKDDNRSLISKICNYICKKLRKTSST